MAKKLFVPERMAKSAESSPVPAAISKGFDTQIDPNEKIFKIKCRVKGKVDGTQPLIVMTSDNKQYKNSNDQKIKTRYS